MDQKQIRAIAALAKLKIDDSEIETVLKDFSSMLSYVDQIKELETSSVGDDEIYFQILETPRKDIAENTLTREDLGANAPKYENGYVVVPRVIET